MTGHESEVANKTTKIDRAIDAHARWWAAHDQPEHRKVVYHELRDAYVAGWSDRHARDEEPAGGAGTIVVLKYADSDPVCMVKSPDVGIWLAISAASKVDLGMRKTRWREAIEKAESWEIIWEPAS